MKKRIKIALTSVCLLAITLNSYAKGQGGIYMNVTDYRNNTLTYEAGCQQKFKIHLHDFFGNTSSFTISEEGNKHTLQKKEVYGYRDCNGDIYRFYSNAAYKIVDAGNIYIYTQERNVTQTKGFKVVNDYFFSTSPDGIIFNLSIDNLVNAYKGNEKFLDRLENFNDDVTAYEARHKMFKINYLYLRSQK